MATHSGVLAWRIPGTGEPGGLYSPQGHKKSDTTEHECTKEGKSAIQSNAAQELFNKFHLNIPVLYISLNNVSMKDESAFGLLRKISL